MQFISNLVTPPLSLSLLICVVGVHKAAAEPAEFRGSEPDVYRAQRAGEAGGQERSVSLCVRLFGPALAVHALPHRGAVAEASPVH